LKKALLSLLTTTLISVSANNNLDNFNEEKELDLCQDIYLTCIIKCDPIDNNDKREQCDNNCDIAYNNCIDKLVSK
jgi:hypothetical protein